jgi:hypothetical protein
MRLVMNGVECRDEVVLFRSAEAGSILVLESDVSKTPTFGFSCAGGLAGVGDVNADQAAPGIRSRHQVHSMARAAANVSRVDSSTKLFYKPRDQRKDDVD